MQTRILLCAFLFTGEMCLAQVQVTLKQPPPNQLRATDLWNLVLTNPTKDTLKVFLEAVLKSKDGGVSLVSGKSKPFPLKPGMKNITYNDVHDASVTYNDPNWRDVFMRTGQAPSGNYVICVYVKNSDNRVICKDCIEQNVANTSPLVLISPADGEMIPDGQQPTFTWMPPMPVPRGAAYRIKITEVLGTQPVQEAAQRNTAWLEKNDIRTTTLRYPSSARRLEPRKKYAWRVDCEGVASEVRYFTISTQTNCASLSAEFIKTMRGDTSAFQVQMNNATAVSSANSEAKSFHLRLKNDSIVSVIGAGPSGWTRNPGKIPPRTRDVTWTAISGGMPAGKTDFGTLCIGKAAADTLYVVYEWLNGEGQALCHDSTALPLKEMNMYYVLSKDRYTGAMDIAGNTLKIQFINNYASNDQLDISITDVESQSPVVSKSTKGDGHSNDGNVPHINNFNGLNRISVNLQDYNVQAGKHYLMTVSDSKSNYYLNFKVSERP